MLGLKGCKGLRGRVLAYCPQSRITDLTHRPSTLELYPESAELPDISQFCFPDGVKVT
jgi:hypothetical protein